MAPATIPTSRVMLIRTHEAAKVLTGSLRTLIELIRECPQVGVGLLRLDRHLRLPDGEDPDPGEPERAARWRAAIATLKADLRNATIGWTEVTDGPDRSLQRVLTASGKGASCGPIECPSYHELVIVLGRGIIDPSSFKDSDREPLGTKGSVVRLRAVGALTDGNPWREIIDGLDREFDKALGLLPQEAGTGRLVPEVRGDGDPMTQAASASGTPTEAPQVPNIVSARLEHDAPPSQAHPTADTKQMIGWREILMALGRDPSSRRDKDRVQRLNNDTNGPIKRTGKRSVIANHGELLAWWKIAASRAEEMAHARAIADRNHSVIDRTLSNPGVRKDEGFHAKERPNRRNGGGR
jgi:hypothetical protein